MKLIIEKELQEFKEFCKKRKIKDSFNNYIVWKDKYNDNCRRENKRESY